MFVLILCVEEEDEFLCDNELLPDVDKRRILLDTEDSLRNSSSLRTNSSR